MSRRRTMHQSCCFALLVLAACATGVRHPPTTPRDATVPRYVVSAVMRDAITEADIAHSNATNAWDAVRTLRGSFLASRGVTTFLRADGGATPAVFVDGMYVGPLSELRDIPAST